MKRRLTGISAIFLVASLVLGGLSLWLGENVLKLAFVHEQRNQPLVIVGLVDERVPADDQAGYLNVLADLVDSEGGEFLDDFQRVHALDGAPGSGWQRLVLLQLAHASDIARITTADPLQRMLTQAKGRLQLVGSFELPRRGWLPVLAVFLVRDRAMAPELRGDPLQPILDSIALSEGRLEWYAPLLGISRDAAWQRLLVVGFASEAAALAWVRDPRLQTARAVVRSAVHTGNLAIFTRANGIRGR